MERGGGGGFCPSNFSEVITLVLKAAQAPNLAPFLKCNGKSSDDDRFLK